MSLCVGPVPPQPLGSDYSVSSSQTQCLHDGHGCVPAKFMELKFEFNIIFMCHKISSFYSFIHLNMYHHSSSQVVGSI